MQIRVGTGSHRCAILTCAVHAADEPISRSSPFPPMPDEEPQCTAQAGWRELPEFAEAHAVARLFVFKVI